MISGVKPFLEATLDDLNKVEKSHIKAVNEESVPGPVETCEDLRDENENGSPPLEKIDHKMEINNVAIQQSQIESIDTNRKREQEEMAANIYSYVDTKLETRQATRRNQVTFENSRKLQIQATINTGIATQLTTIETQQATIEETNTALATQLGTIETRQATLEAQLGKISSQLAQLEATITKQGTTENN